MGSIPYKKLSGCDIQDRDIENPLLVERYEDEPVLDIREAVKKNREDGVIGETGAEPFFCDSMQCVKQKDEVLQLCGMECHEDVINSHLNDLCEAYKDMHDSISRKRKEIEKQEKLLEALAVKLDYEHLKFSPDGVMMVKNGISYHFPPKRSRHSKHSEYSSWNSAVWQS